MSSDFLLETLPYVGILAVGDVLALYAAYLAFSVWRGLADSIHRSRALWTGLLALILPFAALPSDFAGPLLFFLVYPAFLLVLMVWIDKTISSLIRLDYLRRDLFHWRRFRPIYWAFAVTSLVLYGVSDFYYVLPVQLAFTAFFLVPLLYAILTLVIGSSRTTDMTFRSHLKWSGFCIATIVLISVTYFVFTNLALTWLPYLGISYSLYKMARFLVPATRLPQE